MRRKRHTATRFAVIDTETTGLSKYDRIVEFACITISNGEIVDEYDTLIQPNRDPGPVKIHGITPTMLQSAPTFSAVAADIAVRLDGAVLVAHNIGFDQRMLAQEVARLTSASFDPGDGVCTYRLTGMKLAVAAQHYGVALPNHHSALDDARAASALLTASSPATNRHLARTFASSQPMLFKCANEGGGITIRRPQAPTRKGSLGLLVTRTDWPPTRQEIESVYLDALDRCLDDGVLEPAEQRWLDDTAASLNLPEQRRRELHESYFELLRQQILADGIVTEHEEALAKDVAAALQVDPTSIVSTQTIPTRTGLTQGALNLGDAVCFTGECATPGQALSRSQLELIATDAGMRPIANVTKKCAALVAADPLSQSGKAAKARRYGIPVISVDEFLRAAAALTQSR